VKIAKKTLLTETSWLEFLECEMEPNLSKDLEVLLRNSLPDRGVYKQLSRVRELVKKTDEAVMPEDGQYYDRLQAKIMDAIEAEEVEKETLISRETQRTRDFAWSSVINVLSWRARTTDQ
jgi:NAD(P)H-nitrite reductase large subunit